MALGGERTDEAAEGEGEAALRLGGREIGHGRRLAEDEGDVGDDGGDHAAAVAERGGQAIADPAEAILALGEELADQIGEGRHQRRIGDVAPELIELARHEVAAPQEHGLVDLVHQRALAHARVARDEEQLRAALAHAIEGLHQGLDLGVAAVELLRDLQAIGDIVYAAHEALGRAAGRGQAGAEIGLQAGRGLVAILRRLGEELHHDGGHGPRDGGVDLVRRDGALGDVEVDQLDGIGRVEGHAAGEHLVEGGAERVEVGAVIERAVHAPGLLGREVAERAFEHVGAVDARGLARERRGQAEVDEVDDAGPGVDHDVGRVHVLVDHAVAVDGRELLGDVRADRERFVEAEAALVEERAQ
ncbi:MAG: hypothetical protein QM820_22815 [Minicystis sp.]